MITPVLGSLLFAALPVKDISDVLHEAERRAARDGMDMERFYIGSSEYFQAQCIWFVRFEDSRLALDGGSTIVVSDIKRQTWRLGVDDDSVSCQE